MHTIFRPRGMEQTTQATTCLVLSSSELGAQCSHGDSKELPRSKSHAYHAATKEEYNI
jgi:hypothetical protein